jgi:two-component system, chemotaxis family, CheB/CheR fusion protein
MNTASAIPPLLLQADNCFYVLLDTDRNIVFANDYFKREFSCAENFSFGDLFSTESSHDFKNISDAVINHTILSQSFELCNDVCNTKWNISGRFNNENNIAGLELLGVYSLPCNELIEENLTKEKKWRDQEKQLKGVLNRLKKIMDSSLDVICSIDERGRFRKVSAASKALWGYDQDELKGKYFIQYVHKEDLLLTRKTTLQIRAGLEVKNFQNRFVTKDGNIIPLIWSSKWDETDKRFYCIARDARESKASKAALKASEEKYKLLFYNNPLPMWIYDVDTLKFIEVNEAAVAHYGFSREEFLEMTLRDIRPPEEVEKLNVMPAEKDSYAPGNKGYWIHQKKNKDIIYVEITAHLINFQGQKTKLVLANDRTAQMKAQKELLTSNERYSFLSKATFDAIWDWDIKSNLLQWNEGIKALFHYEPTKETERVEWRINNVHPEDKDRVILKLEEHIRKEELNWQDEYRFRAADGSYKYVLDRAFTVYDEKKQPVRMIGAMQDLTERKNNELILQQLNDSLEKRASELAESNAELERFAYVASHDLQEPLRMVTSFLQLIEKRYKEKLDKKAHEYIHFAVDGAERMKRLILDLLEYSRVNSSQHEVEAVDLNAIMKEVSLTYNSILKETGGKIKIHKEQLPVVNGSKTQILQLFQNIVGNAIKYRSDQAPRINITYNNDDPFYQFAISDNGIGIDPRFFHKIFIIFQRLHNREQYSGTGIGLAICKKIVDKHGGKIWLESEPGKGSTFYFTLPKGS